MKTAPEAQPPVAAVIRRRRGRHPTAEVDGAQALETAADTVIGSPPPAVRFSGRTPRRRGADARATPRPSRCRLKAEATPAAAVPPEGGSHTCRWRSAWRRKPQGSLLFRLKAEVTLVADVPP